MTDWRVAVYCAQLIISIITLLLSVAVLATVMVMP